MTSLLFVPGDSTRKFESGRKSAAGALILDLEDSVAPDQKVAARSIVREMLAAPRKQGQKLFVRVNAYDTGLTLGDLAAVVPGRPDGIVLPKCEGGTDVKRLALYLDALEVANGLPAESIAILPVATETASAMFGLGTYAGSSPRLWGMTWGGEDLAVSLGALRNRTDGKYHTPYLAARDLCLFAASAAAVLPIDTVYTDLDNLARLKEEAEEARRDGFLAKMVIHPKHVDVVNAAFMPSEAEIANARKIVQAFAGNPTLGVIRMDGKMIDKPHLRAAEKILALVEGKR